MTPTTSSGSTRTSSRGRSAADGRPAALARVIVLMRLWAATAMATQPQTARAAVAAGSEALRRGAWDEARELFEAALRAEESGRAWEGLGWAGWWLHDADVTIRARERAYRALRAAGDRAGAGRVAAWLRLPRVPRRGRRGPRLARAEPSHARRAPRSRGARLARTQRGLLRAE